ncbi:hypothetical protein TNCV_3730931 [Trichonephila clavipes]|nr:hypothetical protein TNCV_3730931 [Trichonephila clavipes]
MESPTSFPTRVPTNRVFWSIALMGEGKYSDFQWRPWYPGYLLVGYKVVSVVLCDEAHFWLNGYVNKQNCHIWSEANPQVYVETPLHPEKLTVWCALWAGGILLQKR